MAVQRRKFRVTTDSMHKWPVAPNILERNFVTDAPCKIWLTDITYIWTWEGWLYLAFVLDLYYREVIGLSMAARVTASLPVGEAFRQGGSKFIDDDMILSLRFC